MSLDSRVKSLESKIDSHLLESGEVRESIKELKAAVNVISNRMWGAAIGSISTLILMVGFLLKVTLWR